MTSSLTRPRRNFDPQKSYRYGYTTFTPQKLVHYSPKWQYSRLFNFPYPGSWWRPRMNTLVVQVQGIAAPNKKDDPNSRAAFGVSFGRDCPYNISGPLHPSQDPTNNRAVIEAVTHALISVIGRKTTGEFDERWKEIIIMLDSEYVAKTFDEWIWDWEADGWTGRSGGRPIENLPAIRSLHNLIKNMEHNYNMSVRFWKVSRKDIGDADLLAKEAMI